MSKVISREELAILRFALAGASDLVGSGDQELRAVIQQCLVMVDDRLSARPKPELSPKAIQLVRAPFVVRSGKTDGLEKPRKPPSGTQSDLKLAERAPKLSGVVQFLNELKLSADDVVAYTNSKSGTIEAGEDYVLFSVAKLEFEIAVCDQIGHATYLIAGIKGPDFWNSQTKQDLHDRLDITAIMYRNAKQFNAKLHEAVNGLSDNTGISSDGSPIERPTTYDVELVEKCIEAHWHATNQMPTQSSTPVEYGPYANGKTTWQAISLALLKERGRSESGPIKSDIPTLADLTKRVAHRLQVYDPYVFRDVPFTEDGIRDTIERYFDEHGKWPTLTADVVDVGPYRGITTWRTIDDALRKGNRGLSGNSSLNALRSQVKQARKTSP